MIGTKLAHYEITRHLGSGGMGDVYQATDSKLGRSVAIKLLPETFAHDTERAARFEREARVLASLNQPNIAAIYGIEQSNDRKFLVMELVEGETLAERIKRGPIPVDESLAIAKQICEALEAAHEKGIIHRDLKPANVKITPEGKVKVLDFGLAKAFENQPANVALSNSPTLSMAATNAGLILGTAAYMSPEQAKGRVVGRGTDIFAFGCVLFEMLSGRPAFGGDDVAEILAHVLTREPDWNALPASVPARLRELLRICLHKDARKRRRDAGDVLIDIDQISTEEPQPVVRSKGNARLAWIAAAVFALTAVVSIRLALRSGPIPPELHVSIITAATTWPDMALSPDGMSVLFVGSNNGRQQLWLRRLDNGEGKPLPGTDTARLPFWSADGRSIGFFISGKILRMDLGGGPPQFLANVADGSGATWNRDGTILFATSLVSPIFRISAPGDRPVAITQPAAIHTYGHMEPRFLPDGKRFLFYATGTPETQGIYLGTLDGSVPKRLTAADSQGEYLDPGHLLYLQQGTLLAREFDVTRGELSGNAQTVADSVASVSPLGLGAFSTSVSGRVAYRAGTPAGELTWYDRAGKRSVVARPDGTEMLSGDLSPDGRRVALDRTVMSNRDVWLLDLLSGATTRFTFNSGQDGFPVWSPDSSQIVFESKRKGAYDLYVKSVGGTVAEHPVLESPLDKWPMDWSKDGAYILYYEANPNSAGDLMALRMSDPAQTPIPVATGPFVELNGQFSPDGKWVAYETSESGRSEIVVQGFPNASNKWQVSNQGGTQPRWSRDGKELYFIGLDFKMMVVGIKISGSSLESTKPTPLFQTRVSLVPKHQYSVSRDGRFLVSELEESATPISLILNWRAK
jgi:eukaryotic-like serine/threonine-protein kinase